jgi:predicted transcriptional regulator
MDTQPRAPLVTSAIVTPSPEVLVQELDGEAVLLNLESERYFGLDDVGTRVWQHLVEYRRLERVCEEMQKEYDVDESTLRGDVLRLVEELIDAGIVMVEHSVADDSSDS